MNQRTLAGTLEDREIWIYWVCQGWSLKNPPYIELWATSLESDRRDADLMLDAQCYPLAWLCAAPGCQPRIVRWPWRQLTPAEIEAVT